VAEIPGYQSIDGSDRCYRDVAQVVAKTFRDNTEILILNKKAATVLVLKNEFKGDRL
jgi:hypothetical protein